MKLFHANAAVFHMCAYNKMRTRVEKSELREIRKRQGSLHRRRSEKKVPLYKVILAMCAVQARQNAQIVNDTQPWCACVCLIHAPVSIIAGWFLVSALPAPPGCSTEGNCGVCKYVCTYV